MTTDKVQKRNLSAMCLHALKAILFGFVTFIIGDKLFGYWEITSACVIFLSFVVVAVSIAKPAFFDEKETSAGGKMAASLFLIIAFGLSPLFLIATSIDGLCNAHLLDYSAVATRKGWSRSLSAYWELFVFGFSGTLIWLAIIVALIRKKEANKNSLKAHNDEEIEWDFSSFTSLSYFLTVYIPAGVALWGMFFNEPLAKFLLWVLAGLLVTKSYDFWYDSMQKTYYTKGRQPVVNTLSFKLFGRILAYAAIVMWPMDFVLRMVSFYLSLWLLIYWIFW